jgi:hypothetical protein
VECPFSLVLLIISLLLVLVCQTKEKSQVTSGSLYRECSVFQFVEQRLCVRSAVSKPSVNQL